MSPEGVNGTYRAGAGVLARHAKAAAEDMAVQAAGAEKERLEKIAEICEKADAGRAADLSRGSAVILVFISAQESLWRRLYRQAGSAPLSFL